MDELAARVITLLQDGRPLKAREIADVLGASRRDVNVVLYRDLSVVTKKDYLHRWSMRVEDSRETVEQDGGDVRDAIVKVRIRVDTPNG